MKISECVEILNNCLERYGDCSIKKLNNDELISIDEIVFIGANRILMKSNTKSETENFEKYNRNERIKNVMRIKNWLMECENNE